MTAEQELQIRAMCADDIPAVYTIEEAAYKYPWPERLFHSCLEVGYRGWLISDQEAVVGYALVTMQVDEYHILNIAVLPRVQNRGVGGQLLTHLIEDATQHKAQLILLEVRASNAAAHRLYEKFGFSQVGVRKGYYPDGDNREDAHVLTKNLI